MSTCFPRPAFFSRSRLAACALLLGGACSMALGFGGDHERARAALQAGEVLPLPQLLERVAREQPGQVLAVELEREDGRWVYELKLLDPAGRLVKLEVDARSAELLRRKGGR
ncbi:PepSY domain-containing protein [Malikia spinosa]|uniref:Peptidase n=1 Tax=Malikia spinosa TaxID=86180 RepID=A0A7C9MQV5_9BURK|nr:PepSY domain-containing protein [Malikia spinosa]MYZ51238.1 peptidase [Malikia spinosa]OGB69783.1 MAG: hypothetical protein A2486_06890 [Burkholderiales bacterium RIFOXYC12_FULL_65_23]